MNKEKRRKKNCKKGQRILAAGLALLLVAGSLNLSDTLNVHAESGSEAVAEESTDWTITDWQWAGSPDEQEIWQDEDTGIWGLGLQGIAIDNQADFDKVVSMLPAAITATLQNQEQREDQVIELALTWSCENYVQDETGNWPVSGDYIFQATLPEGYTLVDGNEKMEVVVQLREAMLYAEGNNAGSYNVEGGISGEDWEYSSTDNSLTIQNSGTYTVIGDGLETQERIIVGENLTVTLTVKSVNCVMSSNAAMSISGTSTVTLILEENNVFSSGTDYAGVEFSNAQEQCSLTIQGAGKLTAKGGRNGAGIGGGRQKSGSNITISGGIVEAAGGTNGAGIGGGINRSGFDITINGGRVKAKGGARAAGIGGGYGGNGSDIIINGGTVEAAGGDFGSGIGACFGSCSDITISGGSVKTTSGGVAANAIGTTPKNGAGQEVYLLRLDSLSEIYTVEVDENTWTRNGNHTDDDGFYLYLTGADHKIVANGKTYNVKWDSAQTSFITQSTPTPSVSAGSTTNSITVSILDYSSDYGNVEYACIKTGSTLQESDWKSSAEASYTFENLASGISYTCYARYAGNDNYDTSDSASVVCSTVLDPSVVTINYIDEVVTFDDSYEVNVKNDFTGTEIASGDSISDYVASYGSTPQNLYVRVKEVPGGAGASESAAIVIPARAQTPAAQVTAKTASSITLTKKDGWEYSKDSGEQKSWNDTYEFTGLGQKQSTTCYVRAKAQDTDGMKSFASAVQRIDDITNAAAYTVTIPEKVTVGGDAVDIKIKSEKAFDLGYNGHVDVKAELGDSFQDGILTLKCTDAASGTVSITSQMEVDGTPFTDLSQTIASFWTKEADAVKIGFAKPANTSIRAGKYSGSVTFAITYGEGQ